MKRIQKSSIILLLILANWLYWLYFIKHKCTCICDMYICAVSFNNSHASASQTNHQCRIMLKINSATFSNRSILYFVLTKVQREFLARSLSHGSFIDATIRYVCAAHREPVVQFRPETPVTPSTFTRYTYHGWRVFQASFCSERQCTHFNSTFRL